MLHLWNNLNDSVFLNRIYRDQKEVAYFLSTERTVSPESYAQKISSSNKGKTKTFSEAKQLRKFVTGMPLLYSTQKRVGEEML